MKMKVQGADPGEGDQLRGSGQRSADDLQEVIVEVKALDFRLPLQFVNYRP